MSFERISRRLESQQKGHCGTQEMKVAADGKPGKGKAACTLVAYKI